MAKVVDAARITAPDGAVWRNCPACGRLAALAPDAVQCGGCTTKTRADSARLLPIDGFTETDLGDIYEAGCTFAAALHDIAHHNIGDPGGWDLWGSGPDELARLHDALDQMASAVKSSRALLTVVERRVRRGGAR